MESLIPEDLPRLSAEEAAKLLEEDARLAKEAEEGANLMFGEPVFGAVSFHNKTGSNAVISEDDEIATS